ncbi:MAG: WcaF family extracellular polysaccharide biosynthesis acetyltransferase [Bacteroidales bacterium]|nr:WcaF family extracellular polysaccharide biosynthesis acetyltransferase [Bacteroidales bacterium]
MNTPIKTDLSKYDNSAYKPGRNAFIRFLWYFTNVLFFINPLNPISSLKVFLLRLFGAKIGKGLVIKPSVNIKYPWRLQVGDYSWIGENVWIDNLADVKIGANCCLSQGALILTGNHNYKKAGFDLITETIILEDGVWIGAKSVVTPGVHCKTHLVLSVNSVLTEKDTLPNTIYTGNPAKPIRRRTVQNN